MKNFYNNPIVYYIIIPVLIGLWPLVIWSISAPNVKDNISTRQTQFKDSQRKITEILKLDPEIMNYAKTKDGRAIFKYYDVISKTSTICQIPAKNCTLNTKGAIKSRKGKSQSATVSLKDVDIVKFSRFVSMLQFRWPDLKCDRIKLRKKKQAKNLWDIDMNLKYIY